MIRLFRLADLSAVEYQKVRHMPPFLFRRDRKQVLFDLHRVVVLRQAEAIGEPLHVRVNGDAFIETKGARQHDVGRFSSHPRQRDKLLHGLRDHAPEFFDKPLCGFVDVLRLVVKEIHGPDVLGELFRRGVRNILR